MGNKLNTRIGILGGGQLGKMLIESFSPLNVHYTVLENDANCPSSLVCNNLIQGSLYDKDGIERLASASDVLTFEIEHVDVQTLKSLSTPCIPYPSVLEIIQDKGLQKDFYTQHQVSTLDYKICTSSELAQAVEYWPEDRFVLKHRKGGYDGKGVQILDKARFVELHKAGDEGLKSETGYVLEKIVEGAKEISVIVCVGQDGELSCYPACEMVFDPKANLMDYLICPSTLSEDMALACQKLAKQAVAPFKSPGIFAVEMFVTNHNEVFVNEIAPRPHNSGHHSIESCYTSQYEQLNRILLNLSLGSVSLIKPALTANILGPEGLNGEYQIDGLDKVLKIEGVYLHMYGKKISKPYRKLGHVNILADTTDECINKMHEFREYLRINAKN